MDGVTISASHLTYGKLTDEEDGRVPPYGWTMS